MQVKTNLEAILSKTSTLSQSYPIDHSSWRKDATRYLNEAKPRVIIYGRYNAGKSTLVNALLSKDGSIVADISDAPCTSEVHHYSWNGVELVDTPGIHAPIAHQNIAKQKLHQASLILFVISSSGSFDDKEIIAELRALVTAKLPLFIVINNKDGFSADSPELQRIMNQIQSHLSDCRVSPKQLSYLLVNAKSGFQAKLYHQEPHKQKKLWEKSGMDKFCAILEHRILNASEEELFLPAFQVMEKGLQELEKEILKNLQNAEDNLAQNLLQELTDEQRQTELSGANYIRSLEGSLVSELFTSFHNQQNGERAVQQYLDSIQKYTQSLMQQTAQNLENRITHWTLPQTQSHTDTSNSANQLTIDPKIVQQFLSSKQGQQLIKQGLLRLKDWNLPIFRDQSKKVLSQWAQNIAKGIGPFIQVASFVFDIFQASKEQKEFWKQEQLRIDQCKQAAQDAAFDVQRQILQIWTEQVEDYFTPIQKEWEKHLLQNTQDSQKHSEALKLLRGELNALLRLRYQNIETVEQLSLASK